MTDIGVSWPGGFAHLVRNAVAIEKLDQLAVEAHTLADCPNFWMPKVYQPGKGLAFHFDKDEHAMKERSEMVQPILSSVLYLTGDTSTDRIGPTVILDQHYDCTQGRACPDSPSRMALVYPKENNYVLFDGRLGHGVLDSASSQPRMTLLINWWADKPQGIDRITQDLIKQQSLSRGQQPKHHSCSDNCSHNSAGGTAAQEVAAQLQAVDITAKHTQQGTCQSSCNTDSSNETPAQQQDSSNASSSGAQKASASASGIHRPSRQALPPQSMQSPSFGAATDSGGQPQQATLTAESSSQVLSNDKLQPVCGGQYSCEAPKPKELPVLSISIAGWDDSPVTVDDVLAIYKLQLTGPKAIHAVAIDHTGFELFPLDEENREANGGNIMTAAAFVPCGMMSSDSTGASSESGSET